MQPVWVAGCDCVCLWGGAAALQRHEEPKTANDEYEQGTYVYFDYNIVHDDQQARSDPPRVWPQYISMTLAVP